VPYYIFNTDGRCLASSNTQPNLEDVQDRGQICLFDERDFMSQIHRIAYRGEGEGIYLLPQTVPLEQQRLKALRLAQDAIWPLAAACELGVATSKEQERLHALREYMVALMRLPEKKGWPSEEYLALPPAPPELKARM
jgi:hypothetical protein